MAVPVKRPVGGADVTLAVSNALVRLLFSFKRLGSTYPGREKIKRTTASIPSAFSFLFFLFFGNGVGEHAKGGVVTLCKEIQDSL